MSPPDLPTKDLQLVAEDEDLDVLRAIASRWIAQSVVRRRMTAKASQLSTAGG